MVYSPHIYKKVEIKKEYKHTDIDKGIGNVLEDLMHT